MCIETASKIVLTTKLHRDSSPNLWHALYEQAMSITDSWRQQKIWNRSFLSRARQELAWVAAFPFLPPESHGTKRQTNIAPQESVQTCPHKGVWMLPSGRFQQQLNWTLFQPAVPSKHARQTQKHTTISCGSRWLRLPRVGGVQDGNHGDALLPLGKHGTGAVAGTSLVACWVHLHNDVLHCNPTQPNAKMLRQRS